MVALRLQGLEELRHRQSVVRQNRVTREVEYDLVQSTAFRLHRIGHRDTDGQPEGCTLNPNLSPTVFFEAETSKTRTGRRPAGMDPCRSVETRRSLLSRAVG